MNYVDKNGEIMAYGYHSVHWGINPPQKHPLFLAKHAHQLKSACWKTIFILKLHFIF